VDPSPPSGDQAHRLKEDELEAVNPPPPPPGGRVRHLMEEGVNVVNLPPALGARRACGADCVALGEPIAYGEGQASAGR
jgi:hypothetical protein